MPRLPVLAVFALILALIGGMHLYLSCRVHQCLRLFFPQLPFGYAAAFFLLMALVLVFGFARSMLPVSAAVRSALGMACAYWMGLFVYLLVYMVLTDVLYIVIRGFCPAARLRAMLALAAVLCAMGTAAYGVRHAGEIVHVSYDADLSAAGLKEETTLVLISDVHLGAVGSEKRLERIVNAVNERQPDVICIAGDFFDNDFNAIRDPEKAAETIGKLRAKHGVYMCPGNHDSGETVPQMLRFLETSNIRLLADEYAVVDGRLVLAGRLDPSPIGGFDGRRRAALESVLSGAPEGLPVVVMDHNPAGAASYGGGVSLVLSGHTHKGQIFPGSLFTDRMFDVDYGAWQKDASSPQVIVSSGAGTWGMPMRVGTDCEVVTVTLHP